MRLIRCEGCARHVRADEGSCPFCGAAVDAPPEAPPRLAPARAGRAAIFLFGAAIGGTAVGCGSTTPAYGVPPDDAGMEMTEDAGGPAPAYGAVPVDAGFDAGGGGALYGGPPGDAGS